MDCVFFGVSDKLKDMFRYDQIDIWIDALFHLTIYNSIGQVRTTIMYKITLKYINRHMKVAVVLSRGLGAK